MSAAALKQKHSPEVDIQLNPVTGRMTISGTLPGIDQALNAFRNNSPSGTSPETPGNRTPAPHRRKLSAAGRKRISDAQRARHAQGKAKSKTMTAGA